MPLISLETSTASTLSSVSLPQCIHHPEVVLILPPKCLWNFCFPDYFHHCCLSWNKLIFSCLGYFNNLLIGLPAYEFCPLQSATRIIFQKQKWLCHSAEKPLLASLSIKISFKFCSMAQSCFTSLPQPPYKPHPSCPSTWPLILYTQVKCSYADAPRLFQAFISLSDELLIL